jgi:hypothetical protein
LAEFYYILETGAGWRGPIGQGDIIFRFPYEASLEMIESSGYFWPAYTSTTPSLVAEGRDLRWHFTNLEPSSQDNVHLSMITPPVWQAILDARRHVLRNPSNAQAQIQLGEAYWAAIPVKNDWPEEMSLAQHFGPLAEAAFKRAVELAPNSVLAQLSYARFLTYHAWSETPDPFYSRAVQQVNHVLEIDSTNREANDLANFLRDTIYTYYVVTPTPTTEYVVPTSIPLATLAPKPAATAAPTRQATDTPMPTAIAPTNPTPQPSTDSTNASGLPLLGGGVVVVIVLAVLYSRLKR